MVRLIRFLLSVVIGVVAGFVLGLISDGLFYLGSFILVALFVGGIVYEIMPRGLDLVIAVVVGIAAFFSMVYLHSYLEEFGKSLLLHSIILFAPYSLATWLFFEIKAAETNNSDSDSNDSNGNG